MISKGIELDAWLLTEAVRRREQRLGRWRDDEAAMTLALEAPAVLDRRLSARARALPGLGAAGEDIQALGRNAKTLLYLLALIGGLAGWFAARASTADREMDLLLATLTLIGLPSLLLVVWLLVWIGSGRSSRRGGVLLSLVARLLAWLGPRFLASPLSPELAQSAAASLATGAGRWWLSLGSHLLWLGFSIGALVGLLLHFSVAQYDLGWGTTILSEQSVSLLIQSLAWLPQTLGLLPELNDAFIERGRIGGVVGADRAVWAQFLMLMVLLYVALPRLIMVVLAYVGFRRCAQAVPLALGQPGYLRLKAELLPQLSPELRLGVAPDAEPDREPRRRPDHATRPVMVGLELNSKRDIELAGLLGDAVIYLGSADRRTERQALIEALEAMQPPPSELFVVCSLQRTPDTGTARFIERLADAARGALSVLAIDAALLQERGGCVAARQQDWQRLAEHIGGQLKRIELSDRTRHERADLFKALGLNEA